MRPKTNALPTMGQFTTFVSVLGHAELQPPECEATMLSLERYLIVFLLARQGFVPGEPVHICQAWYESMSYRGVLVWGAGVMRHEGVIKCRSIQVVFLRSKMMVWVQGRDEYGPYTKSAKGALGRTPTSRQD